MNESDTWDILTSPSLPNRTCENCIHWSSMGCNTIKILEKTIWECAGHNRMIVKHTGRYFPAENDYWEWNK